MIKHLKDQPEYFSRRFQLSKSRNVKLRGSLPKGIQTWNINITIEITSFQSRQGEFALIHWKGEFHLQQAESYQQRRWWISPAEGL